MSEKKKSGGALLGAAFLMATSAIGPGFLTQTATFTGQYQESFGFVILVSVILAAIAQLNIWRVLCVTGLRGQDVSNKVLPGLGYLVSILIVFGGLVFNIGNVGGGALGFNTLLGIPTKVGYILAGLLAILVFVLKNAKSAMDTITKVLGAIMIIVIFVVIIVVKPPVGSALKNTFVPEAGATNLIPAILTLLGGTVGGYITFSGAHRLIDAGITGEKNLKEINKSSVMGMIIATIVRIFLFLAVLGVVVKGVTLDAANPAADAFKQGAGAISVQSNAMEIAPATADPTIQEGSTRRGSDAANGIAPSVINARPMIKLVGPASLSSFVNLSLNSSVASAIAQGGVIPPIITAAIIS